MTWWGWLLGYVVVASLVSVEMAARAAEGEEDGKVDVWIVILMAAVWPVTLLALAWVYGFEWRRDALRRADSVPVPAPPPIDRGKEWD